MTPREEQHHNPLDDLESPFLSGELFGDESESSWDAQLNLLEAESPFLRAFEESSTPGEEPSPYSAGYGAETESASRMADENFEVAWDTNLHELYDAPLESEIFGGNDMDAVANHLAMPFRWICRLDIEYEITPWGSTRKLTGRGRGSGTLISSCHILTAAHNVTGYDPVGRNFLQATRIQVTAAHDGTSRPPVATVDAEMSMVRLHPRWRPASRADSSGGANATGEIETNRYDYALLTLKKPIGQSVIGSLGGPLGSWSQQGSGGSALFERLDPNILSSNAISVSGYGYDDCIVAARRARSKPGIPLGSQLTASGQITLIWEGTQPRYVGRSMVHNADTCGGQSGAPVWMQRNGKFYLVGVHTGGVGLTNGGRTNHAVRVTAEVITQVTQWMAQSPCPVTHVGAEREGPVEGEALYLNERIGDAEFDDAEFDDAEFYDAEYGGPEYGIAEFDDTESDEYQIEDAYEEGEEEDYEDESLYAEREGEDLSDEEFVQYEKAAFPEALLAEIDDEENALYLEAFDVQEAPALDEALSSEFEEEQETGGTSLRARIVEVAKREWEKWGRGTKSETDPTVTDYLQEYHRVGVGRSVSRSDLRSTKWHEDHPWSAVFISYVMKSAGAGNTFAYRSAHTGYVAVAKKNMLAGDASKFRAFEISAVKPEVGDLVCRDRRSGRGKPCSGTNFSNVDKGGKSHCDIVVEVLPDSIIVMGGNTSQEYPSAGKGGHTVGQRKIRLDARGHVDGTQPGCKFFAIMKAPGAAIPTPSPSGGAASASLLPSWLSEFVKSGVLTLQAAWALFTGQRDVNTLTNMIFYARHPDLPVGYKIKPHEKQLAESWTRIRDDVVRPILNRIAASTTGAVQGATSGLPSTTSSTPIKTSASVIAKVEQYRTLVDAAAAQYGVDSALIRGVIAAESGGNKDLVAPSGYTGLMQAERDPSHKAPAISINAGTKKLKGFRAIMEGILKARGRRFEQLSEIEQLRLLVLAYNAGPVTVAKALQYAAEAGNPERWLDGEHYKRALYFTGAYSISTAAKSCLAGVGATERATRISEANRVWGQTRLRARLKQEKKTSWRNVKDPPPWSSIVNTLPPMVVCAIEFKHRNSPKYADKILAYREAFRQRHGI